MYTRLIAVVLCRRHPVSTLNFMLPRQQQSPLRPPACVWPCLKVVKEGVNREVHPATFEQSDFSAVKTNS